LVPLRRADGTVFIVDRGWVKPGNTGDSPDYIPQAPAGIVTVISRLKASEPALAGRSAPTGQVATIELPLIAEMLGQPIFTGAYGVLVSETPAPAEAPPLPATKPERDEGPHLSYALQWYVFAIFGFLGFGYALRQEYRLVNIDDPAEQLRAKDRKTKESLRSPTDSEIEEAIIEQQR
jgi:cytochrome oxidase assembly protein ShyY1